MSKFNKVSKDKDLTTNYEGEKAWVLSDDMALYTRVCTCILNGQFYTPDFNDELNRIRSLIRKVDPMFVAQLAIYARREMNLRSIPLVLAVELAKVHKGDSLIRRLSFNVIQRADEITEMLSYYVAANGRKKKSADDKVLGAISKQLAKGIADAFHKFDEYQFKKYDASNKDIKIKDALFLTHPKPQNEAEKLLFKKIANSELSKASTWETASSDMGQKVAQAAKDDGLTESQKNELKSKSAKDMWERKIDARGKGEIGYMALLRNLSNFLKYDVSDEHIVKVAERLSNKDEVLRSKQFPFRFVTAHRILRNVCNSDALPGNEVGRFYYNKPNFDNGLNLKRTMNDVANPKASILIDALEEAVKHACTNIPSFDFDTKVLIASDVSGSMQKPISDESVLQCYDIGLALSMMLHYKCKVVSAGMFGDDFMVVPMPKDQILRNVDEMHQLEGYVGYSTNGYLVIDYAIKASEKGICFDKVFIFSDNQLWNSKSDLSHINKQWTKFKKMAPKAKLYIFDLGGYGTSPVNLKQNDVFLIAGWSEKIFDMLRMLDEGATALDTIKKIEV